MANENMIQKHVDNFLAEIAGGATPVDLNPRDSKEFWLKEIAKWTGGKSTDDASTKKIYWHTVLVIRNATNAKMRCLGIVLNNDPTPIDTPAFKALLDTPGFYMPVTNGTVYLPGANTYRQVLSIYYDDTDAYAYDYYEVPYTFTDVTVSQGSPTTYADLTVTDLGANPIN